MFLIWSLQNMNQEKNSFTKITTSVRNQYLRNFEKKKKKKIATSKYKKWVQLQPQKQ